MGSTVAIHMYRSAPLVPSDSCLTAVACPSSVMLAHDRYAVSQASDMALLVVLKNLRNVSRIVKLNIY